ncbi:hypothetical protein COLO4_38382 [Corchorus olitorius]|uniref:Uncharacterized protein n=1 Tax=Corchorus olitorius TaxID=93759 RepID=A0A1R3FVM7_9ROSI|nr:hypothetical protein COLO4_38382 [Corchorus olitorius]
MVKFPTLSATHLCSHGQSAALIQFKSLFSINKTVSKDCEYGKKSYPKTNTWKEGIDCCLWDGVSCDNITGQVISLDLSCSWLSGTFPSNNTIFLLSQLQSLDLSFNDFKKSTISSNFGRFASLTHLDLSSSSFSGRVPYEISFLSKLVSLDLSVDSEIDLLVNFEKYTSILTLEKSTLDGIVGNLTEMNNLHGIIPPTFTKECGLMYLNLNSNDLEGPLTPTISNCKDLKVLDLGNNMINDTFPDWIEALPELQVLVLHSNHFQGSVVASKNPQSLSKLQIIDLSNNNFSGPLPTSYMKNLRAMMNLDKGKAAAYINGMYDFSIALVVKGLEVELVKILTIFTSIDLSKNNFQGEIPELIGELTSLRGLNLSHNNLVGDIPPSLGKLSSLEWLDLSSNKLDGQIPRELLDLTFLSLFNVSYNHLVGPIPQGKQFNTYENGSYQGNEGLCGFPLSRGCSSSNKQPPEMSSLHEEEGSMFDFGWKIVAIGYGFGFIFGVGMGCIALRMGKPKWLMTLFKLKKY